MPEILNDSESRKKRKREDGISKPGKSKRRIVEDSTEEVDFQAEILLMENEILESRKNYNSILKLHGFMQKDNYQSEQNLIAAVALCRIYCKLMVMGRLVKARDASDNEITVVKWLKEQYRDYKNALLHMLEQGEYPKQSSALTFLMRLVKAEKTYLNPSDDIVWRTGIFAQLVKTLIYEVVADETREEFAEKYVGEYDDVRYYTFGCLAYFFGIDLNLQSLTVRSDLLSADPSDMTVRRSLFVMETIEGIPDQHEEFEDFFAGAPNKAKHDLFSLTAHRKQAQKAWMAMLRNPLSKAQRKRILELMSHEIAPWFLKVEMLMDFLTDCFNFGGSTSLMALSGLFYLIQHKNLDYPQFYLKLYSLLDANILHSKHRSRFFRLLDKFLASTHLPAALVASFIKRLSRLTLHAPPSSIVVVVPWIYNLLKSHPYCTFMIHRNGDVEQDEDGWGDPFRMDEPDPMRTDALESSLWEIQTLQSHYHPNVATIAKIISEQFTKQSYNLEDFLDHSYGTVSDNICERIQGCSFSIDA